MTRAEVLNADGTPVRNGLRPGGRRRRHSGRKHYRASLLRVILVATATIVFGGGVVFRSWVETSIAHPATDGLPVVADPVEGNRAPADRAARVVYPFSIVPGGVHSADEAREAMEADPMVAVHYRDVAIDALRVERVTRPRAVYVSYRRGNEVYWTKRKLALHPGEALMTDGKNEIRARCGNRISDDVQAPVSESDPAAEVLDQSAPIVVPDALPSLSLSEWEQPTPLTGLAVLVEPYLPRPLDANPLPGLPMLLQIPFVSDRGFAGGPGPAYPAAVPEPGTLMLVGVGLGGAILRVRWRRSHKV